MQRNILSLIFTSAMIAIGLIGCQIKQSAIYAKYDDIQPEDLIGVWEANYENKGYLDELSGTEILVINADGTFQQSYNGTKGYSYAGELNRWELVRLSNGKAQIHLANGVFFPEIFVNLGVPEDWKDGIFSVYDPVSGKNIVFSKEVILNILVGSGPPDFILLEHLPAGDPDSPIIIQFSKLP